MEDLKHRQLWGRAFAVLSVVLGFGGLFSAGIASFFGGVVGICAIREKTIGKYWLFTAWVGTIICVSYFVFVFGLSFAWMLAEAN